ncbi:hypothetical protein GWI33_004618 [Rhynchophorus ferrugineus]|uniref:Uncharacterized protein n=1 Tax=Rhynchophorus ferrugineus TaxID=354439 RepID=A0A834IWZ3_RHYFE|nr:hypothetical protein GWI33_004618 [Rhynchophorus ferrugineus]
MVHVAGAGNDRGSMADRQFEAGQSPVGYLVRYDYFDCVRSDVWSTLGLYVGTLVFCRQEKAQVGPFLSMISGSERQPSPKFTRRRLRIHAKISPERDGLTQERRARQGPTPRLNRETLMGTSDISKRERLRVASERDARKTPACDRERGTLDQNLGRARMSRRPF